MIVPTPSSQVKAKKQRKTNKAPASTDQIPPSPLEVWRKSRRISRRELALCCCDAWNRHQIAFVTALITAVEAGLEKPDRLFHHLRQLTPSKVWKDMDGWYQEHRVIKEAGR